MNDILKHYRSLPRRNLQSELRRFTGDAQFYLWEFIGLSWIYQPVRAGKETAIRFGVKEGEIIGYHVPEGGGHINGGALGDLVNTTRQAPPYPDPFA